MSNIRNTFQSVKDKLAELETTLGTLDIGKDPKGYGEISQEYAETQSLLEQIHELESVDSALADAKEASNDSDPELAEMAKVEVEELSKKQAKLETVLQVAMLPKDPLDKRNIILEIRAGAGGDEAGLFAAEVFRMYQHYAERQGWTVELMSTNRTGIGGYKEVVAQISGTNVYSNLKFESGVHRVQRVPDTEKSGRVHTSTITVAILPEAEEIDVEFHDNDIRIDVYRASGNGGQSVNTTDSAVRITHIETGLVVSMQDEKSQHKNKAKALTILRSRLLQLRQDEEAKKRRDARRGQIGTGDRSEKIRTYNFPQDRITDHRITTNFSAIDRIMDGNIEPVLEALHTAETAQRLEQLS